MTQVRDGPSSPSDDHFGNTNEEDGVELHFRKTSPHPTYMEDWLYGKNLLNSSAFEPNFCSTRALIAFATSKYFL